MMRIIAISLLIMFFLIVFGVMGILGIGSRDHGEHYLCPVFAMSGGECPSSRNILAFATHHISGLRSLTEAIPSPGFTLLGVGLFLSLVFGLALSRTFLLNNFMSGSLPTAYGERRRSGRVSMGHQERMLRWLALHEKRDACENFLVHDFLSTFFHPPNYSGEV